MKFKKCPSACGNVVISHSLWQDASQMLTIMLPMFIKTDQLNTKQEIKPLILFPFFPQKLP